MAELRGRGAEAAGPPAGARCSWCVVRASDERRGGCSAYAESEAAMAGAYSLLNMVAGISIILVYDSILRRQYIVAAYIWKSILAAIKT